MKIAHYVHDGTQLWGAVEGDSVRPLVGAFDDWAPAITREGPGAAPLGDTLTPLSSVRLVAPVLPHTRVFGTGMNYRSHTEPAKDRGGGHAAPTFMVPLETIIGPDDELKYPDITNQLDYEIELVCVMGTPVQDVDAPLQAVLGYTVGSDTSARDAGAPVGLPLDFISMKGNDRTRPLGPWIVTRDELGGNEQPSVYMTTTVNGEQRQHDTTGAMAWTMDRCVTWVNGRAALRAGDLIFTGTCGGTAVEDELRNPGTGRWLQPGDRLELDIEGIGSLAVTVGPRSPHHVGYPTGIAEAVATR